MSAIVTKKAPIRVVRRNSGDDTILEFEGTLDSSLPVEMREHAWSQIGADSRLVIDLSRLEEVSGIGVRMLLMLFRQVRAAGGKISITGAQPNIVDLAESAGLLHLFQTKDPVHKPIRARASVRIDAYPTRMVEGYAVRPGFPTPFGATPVAGGVNFAVYSRHATTCTLVLFEAGGHEPVARIPFPPEFRIGDVFAMTVFDIDFDGTEYGYSMDGPFEPERGHRFDATKVLLDPMARIVGGRGGWGVTPDTLERYPYRARITAEDFDWEGDAPLHLPFEDLVIYEMHVRGFTCSPSSDVKHRGTFAGMREKIPYLKALGINCVELLPIFEFDETENERVNPHDGQRLCNFWGYNTVAFFAPKAGYAATGEVGLQADEFKTLVKELHKHGIEVILDVVFNHTGEGNEQGPTISFRGLDNRVYYMLTPRGEYYNFSGCGNTVNCNHPVVRGFVIECLRYWVAEYHIDGFRFDLASILGRAPDGTPLGNPPLLEALAADPVLGRTKLIAEAWDAGGLYQVGSFPAYGRWAEWNGKFRDCARKFLKGDAAQVGEMSTRIEGSPDLYTGRGAAASINFVTCHDGFTLADLVSYNDKHNEANGEANRDGANDNHSWNCGIEGPTDDSQINALRRRQIKNSLAMLLVSQGVPMLLMGDECGRTQQGNNNTYCQDNALGWFDWTLVTEQAELLRFCRLLIQFRKQHPALRHPLHPGPGAPEVHWHGTRAGCPDTSAGSRVSAFHRVSNVGDGLDVVYVAMNMHWEGLDFALPGTPRGQWRIFANTAMNPPEDICEPGNEPQLADQGKIHVGGRSITILVAR